MPKLRVAPPFTAVEFGTVTVFPAIDFVEPIITFCATDPLSTNQEVASASIAKVTGRDVDLIFPLLAAVVDPAISSVPICNLASVITLAPGLTSWTFAPPTVIIDVLWVLVPVPKATAEAVPIVWTVQVPEPVSSSLVFA